MSSAVGPNVSSVDSISPGVTNRHISPENFECVEPLINVLLLLLKMFCGPHFYNCNETLDVTWQCYFHRLFINDQNPRENGAGFPSLGARLTMTHREAFSVTCHLS